MRQTLSALPRGSDDAFKAQNHRMNASSHLFLILPQWQRCVTVSFPQLSCRVAVENPQCKIREFPR
jgi:hypothetical protein